MMAEKSKSLLQKRKNKTILEEENKTQILVDLAVLEESNLQKKKKEKEKRKINNQEIDKKEEEIKENDQNTPTEENTRSKVEGYFSSKIFEDLDISDNSKKAIDEMGYKQMTEIQARSFPFLVKGRDVLGAAKTGSGKTLAFLLPAVELLYKTKFNCKNGTGILIITPTRELATQIYSVAKELLHYHSKTHGMVIGGTDKKTEALKLRRGINLLVATPGRLLDHLQSTKGFLIRNLLMLIIDEADALLKMGFEQEMNEILRLLPSERQTMLFSATMTKKVSDLVRLSLQNPVLIEVGKDELPTVNTLEQGYVIIEPDKKFMLLYTFLQRNKGKKIMVFMSSCNAVKFYSDVLNYVDLSVLEIHGRQKQQKRSSTYYTFCQSEHGILLCTDVAQRGLDFPNVDWIVQYDPPDEPDDYIHRVGRTARGAEQTGKALLFLFPTELGFLRYLKKKKVPLNEYEFPQNKLSNIYSLFEKLIGKNYYLNKGAKDAYRSFLQAYASHKLKDIYNVNNLDLLKIARSFGLDVPPKVHLNLKLTSRPTFKKGKGRSEFFS